MLQSKYFLALGDQRQGPFGAEELAARMIDGQTPVWKEGMPRWLRAREVPELQNLLATLPPPLPNVSGGQTRDKPPTRAAEEARPAPSSAGYQPGRFVLVVRGIGALISGLLALLVAIAVIARGGTFIKDLWKKVDQKHEEPQRQQHGSTSQQSPRGGTGRTGGSP